MTLERFVLRARRIAAHSLVANDELADLKTIRWTLRGSDDGPTTMAWTPPDEERFESLAARLRPLILGRESIHYASVIQALRVVVKGEPELNEKLDTLNEEWASYDLNDLRERSFTVQSVIPGESRSITTADGVLAAGWMYADLVHADPLHGKEKSLNFPLRERFHAAVHLFANIASVTLATLDFVDSVRDHPLMKLSPSVWSDEVRIDVDMFEREVSAYVAPMGTALPELAEELSAEWKRVTGDLLRGLVSRLFTIESVVGVGVRRRVGAGGRSRSSEDGGSYTDPPGRPRRVPSYLCSS